MDTLSKQRQITEGVIWKQLLIFFFPILLGTFFQQMYNTVDTIIVGRLVGTEALAAVGATGPLVNMVNGFFIGVSSGATVILSQFYGAEDRQGVSDAMHTGVALSLLLGAVLTVLGVGLGGQVLGLMNMPESCMADAVTYIRIYFAGSLGTVVYNMGAGILRAMGDSRRPMLFLMATCVLNVALDLLFVAVLHMGVAGAAVATVIGQIAAAVITGVRGARRPPQFKKLGEYIRPIYFYGFPSIFMQMLYVVYIMLLNVILSGFSDAAVTVLGLYYKWQSFFFIPLFALQTCIVPVLSYNYSRQSYDRCREIVRDSVLFSLALMAVGIFSFEVIPDVLIKIFSQSEEVLEIGKIGIRIIGASFAPAVFSLISPTIFQAIGKAGQSLFLSLFRQVICLVPIFWLFSFVGLNYTWLSFPISETLTTVIGLIWYYRDFVKRFPNEKTVS